MCNVLHFLDISATATFIKSKRGKALLCIDGFSFYSNTTRNKKTRWLCSTHSVKGCRAVVYTYENEIVKLNNEHNHQQTGTKYLT